MSVDNLLAGPDRRAELAKMQRQYMAILARRQNPEAGDAAELRKIMAERKFDRATVNGHAAAVDSLKTSLEGQRDAVTDMAALHAACEARMALEAELIVLRRLWEKKLAAANVRVSSIDKRPLQLMHLTNERETRMHHPELFSSWVDPTEHVQPMAHVPNARR